MLVKQAEDLVIYQIALRLSKEIHELTGKILVHWKINDVGQIRRSSSSVPSNVAEGFGQRFYPKKFIHFLNIALGSSDETKNHLRSLFNKAHIKNEQIDHYENQYKNLSIKILNLINYLRKKHDNPATNPVK